MTFHSSSEGGEKRKTCQAAECYSKAQICLFFKWHKQTSSSEIILLLHYLLAKADCFNMKGVCRPSFVCFLERRKMQEVNRAPEVTM